MISKVIWAIYLVSWLFLVVDTIQTRKYQKVDVKTSDSKSLIIYGRMWIIVTLIMIVFAPILAVYRMHQQARGKVWSSDISIKDGKVLRSTYTEKEEAK